MPVHASQTLELDSTANEDLKIGPAVIRELLGRILGSPVLGNSLRLKRLLSFIVERTLEGRSGELKEYSLAVEVFQRPASFDPRLDPIVRVQAGNLRTKLKEFYSTTGLRDPVLIELPRGTYKPRFIPRPPEQKAIEPGPDDSETLPGMATIAILPCVDLSPAKDQEHFCDGITEEIIDTMAAIDEVRVVGRTSVFRFKDKTTDIREIGAQLGVQTVLETSLRREESRMRVTTRLIQVASRFTLWSRTFNFQLTKVFAVQENIARSIAQALRVNFAEYVRARLARRHLMDVESYNLYLRGKFHLGKRTEENIRKSISIFEAILSRNPSNALVLSGLAEGHLLLAMAGAEAPSVAMGRAASLARQALSLDDELPEAHATLASVRALYEWDWTGAEREFRHALELSPSNAAARTSYAFSCLLPNGRSQEAIDQLKEALKLDPLSWSANLTFAMTLYALRRYDEAIQQYDKAIDLEPGLARTHMLQAVALGLKGLHRDAMRKVNKALKLPGDQFFLANLAAAGCVYALAGQRRRALLSLEALKANSKEGITSSYWQSLAHARLGQTDDALHLLNDAFRLKDPWLVSIAYEPLADPLRKERRFHSLIRRLNLPKLS
jgi:TolB-like protein/Tfp pilus assembly protein PilF